MLETIREFARERLAASDDADAIGRRHAEWFLALAEEAEPFLKGAEQAVWLQRLEDEHDNLRASLDWFFDHGDVDAAVRLAGTLWLFWYMHGHVTEARRWIRRALDVASDEPSEARAHLLYGAGYLACEQNENDEATRPARGEPRVREGGRSHRDGRDRRRRPLLHACRDHQQHGRSSGGSGRGRGGGRSRARRQDDDFVLAIALNNLGGVMALLGENERAAAYFEESLEVRRRIGDLSRIALSLGNVAGDGARGRRDDQGCRHVRRGGRDRHRDRGQTAHPRSRSQGSAGSPTAKSDGRWQGRTHGRACASHKNSA